MRQREDAQDDVQAVADESKVVERTCHRSRGVGRDDGDDEHTSAARFDRATRRAFMAEGVCWMVARVTTHSRP